MKIEDRNDGGLTFHPLVILAELVDWDRFDQAYEPLFCPDNGAPALPTRLMVGLEYLKYTYNLSDEALVMRWLENPYWQYFCGETYFQTTLPLHDTSLGKWRLRIGAEKLKLVLEETIRLAKEQKFVSDEDLSRVVVDTMVQEKNITFPPSSNSLSLLALDRDGSLTFESKRKWERIVKTNEMP